MRDFYSEYSSEAFWHMSFAHWLEITIGIDQKLFKNAVKAREENDYESIADRWNYVANELLKRKEFKEQFQGLLK